jgi:hypothetical protein
MEAWAKSVKKTRSKLRERTNVHSLLLGDAIVIASMVLASKWEEGGGRRRKSPWQIREQAATRSTRWWCAVRLSQVVGDNGWRLEPPITPTVGLFAHSAVFWK